MTRKVLALALCALMALASAGCGNRPSTSSEPASSAPASSAASSAPAEEHYYNDPGTLPIVKEATTLTFGVPQSAAIEDWETNEYTKYLEDNTGIDLKFETYPLDEFLSKIDLMMAAGGKDLPDVITGTTFSMTSLVSWANAGRIIAVNDYYDTLAHYLPASIADCERTDYDTLLRLITSYDGKIYGLPSYSEAANQCVSQGRAIVYKPWLEALNLEHPTTLDAYREYLEKVRDNDLNGNGDKSDEIPLIGCKNTLGNLKNLFLSPFLLSNGTDLWYVDNGEIKFNYNREEYAQGLRYIRGLLEDGLLDPMTFTQDQAQMTALITGETHQVASFIRGSQSNVPKDDPRWVDYSCYVYALAGPSGQRYNAYNAAVPQLSYIITSNCRYPEAAFLLGDYMGSEDCSYINRYGFKDRDWFEVDPAEGKYVNLYGNELVRYNEANAKWGKLQNTWWGNLGVSILPTKLLHASAIENNPEAAATVYTKNVAESSLDALNYTDPSRVLYGMVYNEEEMEIQEDVFAPIQTYVNECFSRFCLGDLSIDGDWDKYCAELDQMGLDKVRESMQNCYDRMMG